MCSLEQVTHGGDADSWLGFMLDGDVADAEE